MDSSDGRVVIGTDGASRGNPGRSGWAWVVTPGCWQAGSIPHGTNNEAELTAIVRALHAVPTSTAVTILTDSELCVNTLTKWARGWRKKGWTKSDGKPVKNRDLVAAALVLLDARQDAGGRDHTRIEWVRGHNGHPLNEAADTFATQAADQGKGRRLVTGPGWTL